MITVTIRTIQNQGDTLCVSINITDGSNSQDCIFYVANDANAQSNIDTNIQQMGQAYKAAWALPDQATPQNLEGQTFTF